MAQTLEPPPFQMGTRCEVCNLSFTAFRRRHHCRSCGRSFCKDHSSKQTPLPHFALHIAVRVCDDCFNSNQQSSNIENKISSNDIRRVASNDLNHSTSDNVDGVTDSLDTVDLNDDISPPKSPKSSFISGSTVSKNFECKCGMPLCICEAPVVPEVPPAVPETKSFQQPKKVASFSRATASRNTKSNTTFSANARSSLFFTSMQMDDDKTNNTSKDYETSGEGLREAIKNGDLSAVKELLTKGVDSNYCDKQGMSLLHLAAVFNHSDIAFVLMDAGARVDSQNAQGETPLDCAQTMLQYKMREKINKSADPS